MGAQYTRMAAMKQTALQATAIRLPHTILREQTADRFFFNPMSQKYEQPAMAVRRAAGLYTCPLCGKRTQVGHTHCHWCGKKLSWDREAYTDRDYPHMSTKGGRRR